MSSSGPDAACPSCGAAFVGEYCHGCGERRLQPGEFTLRFWARAAFVRWTQLDGPFARASLQLVARPGAPSVAYFDGVRTRYARPIQLFLLANVVFFVLGTLLGIDTLSTNLRTHGLNTASVHRAVARDWIAERTGVEAAIALDRGAPGDVRERFEAIARPFDRAARTYSKTLVFALVPMYGLVSFVGLALVRGRRRRLVSEHFVGSLHLVSYFLLVQVLLFALLRTTARVGGALGAEGLGATLLNDRVLGPSLAALLVWYGYGAARRFHGMGRMGAATCALALLPISFAALVLYRALLFHVTALRYDGA